MPLFFFDFDDGSGIVHDTVGTILPDLEAAKLEVSHALAEIASDMVPESTSRKLSLRVRDENDVIRLDAWLSYGVVETDPLS